FLCYPLIIYVLELLFETVINIRNGLSKVFTFIFFILLLILIRRFFSSTRFSKILSRTICNKLTPSCIYFIVKNHLSDQKIRDRKSTRLNSSHVSISYAVFCLKKKYKKSNRQYIIN